MSSETQCGWQVFAGNSARVITVSFLFLFLPDFIDEVISLGNYLPKFLHAIYNKISKHFFNCKRCMKHSSKSSNMDYLI